MLNATPPNRNIPVFTVGALARAVQKTLEGAFDYIEVEGEISGLKIPASGHVYLNLKDSDAVLAGVCWRGVAAGLAVKPEDGLQVVASGRLTSYGAQSRYQLQIESMRLAGVGALLKQLEERKKRLMAEGLFDAARKKPLPSMPEVIGIITSPTGAVIRDMLHRIEARLPRRVLLYPVAVQGQNAAAQVVQALDYFSALQPGGAVPRPDVLIVARGGGSLEDLWCFNDEEVVRAAARCSIPLISAIGHETDVTLLDFAADVRAPTPTAAAELAVPDGAALRGALRQWAARLGRFADGIPRLEQRLDDMQQRSAQALRGRTDKAALRIARLDVRAAYARLLPLKTAVLERSTARLTPQVALRLVGRFEEGVGRLSERREKGIAQRLEQRRLLPDVRAVYARLLPLKAAILERSSARLNPMVPQRQVVRQGERVSLLAEKRRMGMERQFERRLERLEAAAGMLNAVSYSRVLARGFSVVRGADGAVISSAADWTAPNGEVYFHDGSVRVQRRVSKTSSTTPEQQGLLWGE